MIDPEVQNSDPYVRVSPPCTVCGKRPGIYGECWKCQMKKAQQNYFRQRTDEVLTRVEQDPVFAARLKIALGL